MTTTKDLHSETDRLTEEALSQHVPAAVLLLAHHARKLGSVLGWPGCIHEDFVDASGAAPSRHVAEPSKTSETDRANALPDPAPIGFAPLPGGGSDRARTTSGPTGLYGATPCPTCKDDLRRACRDCGREYLCGGPKGCGRVWRKSTLRYSDGCPVCLGEHRDPRSTEPVPAPPEDRAGTTSESDIDARLAAANPKPGIDPGPPAGIADAYGRPVAMLAPVATSGNPPCDCSVEDFGMGHSIDCPRRAPVATAGEDFEAMQADATAHIIGLDDHIAEQDATIASLRADLESKTISYDAVYGTMVNQINECQQLAADLDAANERIGSYESERLRALKAADALTLDTQSLPEAVDALVALVRALRTERDAKDDRIGKLERVREAAEKLGHPFAMGALTEALAAAIPPAEHDPVLVALQNAQPRTSPMPDELREKIKRGLADVADRRFAIPPAGEKEGT